MFKIFSAVLLLPLLFFSCSNENPVNSQSGDQSGSLSFKIDKANAPANIELVTMVLSRSGFDPLSATMNLVSDTTAELQLNAIPAGLWHLKVDAKNTNGIVEYSGETDINIVENEILQLSLTLYPVFNGTGGIQILVNWGSNDWVDYLHNPILTKFDNPSSPNDVRMSKILFDDGKYKMWYTAVYNSGVTKVWYAESHDGINWNTIGNLPVLDKGNEGSWDGYGVAAAAVIKENNLYKMYYTGFSAHPDDAKWNLGLAVSNDGIHWEKSPAPVIYGTNKYYFLGATDLVKVDSIYYLYFEYRSPSEPAGKIGLANSTDGISWQFCSSNPILSATLDWEYGTIGFPTVIYENGKFKMVYQNHVIQDSFGMAESDNGKNFIKQASPIFKNTSSVNNWLRIAYPFFRKFNNEYRIYYSGENYNNETSINLIRKNL